MNQIIKVAAVVVTYNRREMLTKTIESIINQTYNVSKLIVIDNASTDGTDEMMVEKGFSQSNLIEYIRQDNNSGGAGGFYCGILKANRMNYDWIWIMDDDVEPCSDCLEELIKSIHIIQEKQENKIAFLASSIYGSKGEFMNVPSISTALSDNGYPSWYKYLEYGIVNISDATFVSLLINNQAVNACGFPCKDFFIWGDDTEYTTRLTSFFGEAYLIGKSRAIHNRINAKSLSVSNEVDINRIKMFHYYYRNNAIKNKYYYKRCIFPQLAKSTIKYFFSLFNKTEKKRNLVKMQGYYEAVIQYNKFAKYIDGQLG